ncbi:MAG: VWA domain-containing protein [Acidobacteriota bacterium]|jgi:Ca-activated chloride channel family protein
MRFLLSRSRAVVVAALLAVLAGTAAAAGEPAPLWPEDQRSFYLDGPGWLLSEEQRAELLEMTGTERAAFIERFLSAEDLPAVSADELGEAIERRRRLMRSGFTSPRDVRAQLLFLHGPPAERLVIDCGEAFQPLEIWRYPRRTPDPGGDEGALRPLVVYRPGAGTPWKLWTPFDSKRALYTEQMVYFLEQWHELNGRLFRAVRFDLQSCDETRQVDEATGVKGLLGFERDRPTAEAIYAYLEPPRDLGEWVQRALRTDAPGRRAELNPGPVEVFFPEVRGQRLVTRFVIRLPGDVSLATAPADSGDGEEHRLVVEGLIEEGASVLDRFRVRFVVPAEQLREADDGAAGEGLALVWDEPLRPEQTYMVRLWVRDELGGAASYLARGFRAPRNPEPMRLELDPDRAVEAFDRSLGERQIAGADSLLLVPPVEDIVLGLWRAEAIVTGQRIDKVAFSVDGELQLTDGRPPYSAELRLARFPKEQVVRAEGLDSAGEPVEADEVVINQPRGAFSVRITDPPPGVALSGEVEVTTQVVVPEGRRVEHVVYEVAGEEVARLEHPPWQATVRVPAGGGLTYLSVTATLDDDRTGEDVRLLNAPDFVERVDVDLVELYAAVTEGGRPVKGLTADDFQVSIEGRPVEIDRFQPVNDLPLTVAITIDSSGSMASALVEAQKAARGFLQNVVGVRDHAFAVGFADTPILLMPPTKDADAVADSLGRLRSVGWTALHDAVVTSLYYFRGFPGQRAMVLLSDGDDTRSAYAFEDVLEYARRSGVAIYTVGLNVGRSSITARRKLRQLAEDTGGRVFFIGEASELSGVYGQIEEELRSRYLLAVSPEAGSGEGYREVEVTVDRRGVEVRTARGIYP